MLTIYSAPEELAKPDFMDYFGRNSAKTIQDYEKDVADYINRVQKWAKGRGAHPCAGKYVAVPYADGRAQYIAVKVGGKLGLIHLDLDDAWRDPQFERLATVAEIKRIGLDKYPTR
jgi:hypothetical protein